LSVSGLFLHYSNPNRCCRCKYWLICFFPILKAWALAQHNCCSWSSRCMFSIIPQHSLLCWGFHRGHHQSVNEGERLLQIQHDQSYTGCPQPNILLQISTTNWNKKSISVNHIHVSHIFTSLFFNNTPKIGLCKKCCILMYITTHYTALISAVPGLTRWSHKMTKDSSSYSIFERRCLCSRPTNS